MHEILRHLPEGARVLDLGSRAGSFDASLYPVRAVRLDLEIPSRGARCDFVQADAASLPFPDATFDAVISNHSLEHFERLEMALQELGRVVRPSGSIFIAVPDASTFSDKLYRWLGRGGGHVNAFRSRTELIALVERHTGLHFAGGRLLISSLSILNHNNLAGRAPRKMLLLGGGREGLLGLWSLISRLSDRWLHMRLSLYGWALYFGTLDETLDTSTWSNVCVRCGSGASSAWLEQLGIVKRNRWMLRSYACPSCGAPNIFTRD
ncbi:MAG: class I SAM-dependent methyltransferase [Bryobacteraceae bacterium]|jgi:SAM-dependent methyltransferase